MITLIYIIANSHIVETQLTLSIDRFAITRAILTLFNYIHVLLIFIITLILLYFPPLLLQSKSKLLRYMYFVGTESTFHKLTAQLKKLIISRLGAHI